MARMPLLAAAVGGRRHLFDLWATAPSAVNWQEPLGQGPIPSWTSWTRKTKIILLVCVFLVFLLICFCVYKVCRRKKKNAEQDTNRIFLEPWSNEDDREGVSAPLPPPLPGSGDGMGRQRWRRRQQPTAVAEVPAADVEMAVGDVEWTQADMEWVLANLEWLAPAVNMDMAPPADVEMVPTREPGPTLKCTFSRAEGWEEGTCTVCLSEMVDGEKVRVLTACMHSFHATCIETWLRRNANCPVCRHPVMVNRGRRRRQTQTGA